MSLKSNAEIQVHIDGDSTLEGDGNPVLMNWEIKAYQHSAMVMNGSMAVLGALPLMCFLYGVFFMKMKIPDIYLRMYPYSAWCWSLSCG